MSGGSGMRAMRARTGTPRGARAAAARRTAGRRRGLGAGRDRGQVSIEFLGFLPILIAIALGVIQLGLGAYAVQQAGTGARAAARTASMDEADRQTDPQAAGLAAMSGWISDGATVSVGGGGTAVRATATVQIPSLIPGVTFGSASRSATMARPETPKALGALVRTVRETLGPVPSAVRAAGHVHEGVPTR
ncbi:TadE/TadG family type IV pilus assembly protein [Streptomyces sp. NPDC101393]|uniref:TadE/TadG family type IV pilus assembly protein n=1 Tax=Streptomyces sp. NPDC101393 TaxID=3366141 RepID=UPI00382B4692